MSDEKIKVLVIGPMKPCEVREISGLEAMQDIVGGHIQAVYPFQDALPRLRTALGRRLDGALPACADRGRPDKDHPPPFFL